MKRKLNYKRLYKLLIGIVILVTVFCAFGAWNNTKNENENMQQWLTSSGNCWTEYWKLVDAGQPPSVSKEEWENQHKNDPVNLQEKEWCMAEPDVYYSAYITSKNYANIESQIAVCLPILFFISVVLFKYLFPHEK